mgnify:CR=1 FL=1
MSPSPANKWRRYFYKEESKLLKKTWLLAFLACMSIASSCFALNLIKMGPVTLWSYSPDSEQYHLNKTTTDYYFDADDISVDRYNKTVEFTVAFINFKDDFEQQNGKMEWRRMKIDFSNFDFYTDRKVTFYRLLDGNFYKKFNAVKITRNYIKQEGQPARDDWKLTEAQGRYFRPNAYYNEFAYHLGLPNLDGSSYLTPKSLGLNWIKSTSEFGVFYDPKSVKAKGDSVHAKIYIWSPSVNRIELMSGKFNYSKQTFSPNSVKFIRISDGEITDSYKQGLIPGLVGDKLHTFRFDEEEPITIAADFFKSKVTQ